jgi:hypothetical protein
VSIGSLRFMFFSVSVKMLGLLSGFIGLFFLASVILVLNLLSGCSQSSFGFIIQ